MGIENWNRLINVRFFSKNGAEDISKAIICPVRGRKPNITLNAVCLLESNAFEFELKVKNLYMDLKGNDYPIIQIEAGYENNMRLAFQGSVNYAFCQSPGPESVTVFQCYGTNLDAWYQNTISLKLKAGYTLKEALQKVSTALGLPQPEISTKVATLTSDAPLERDCTAKDVLLELRGLFSNSGAKITWNNNRIKAFSTEEKDAGKHHYIAYLSNAPQITGGQTTEALATVNCPYFPEVKVGDYITFDTNYYTTSSALFTLKKKQLTIKATTINIQFATVGMVNQMTIMGNVV